MNKVRIIAIFGPAGSGKDWLLHKLMECSNGALHEIISTTTRPPRQGEVDGINYHFRTDEEFAALVFNNMMLEAASFNGWFYGTSFEALDIKSTNIGVFNPDGIRALLDDSRIEVFPIRVKCKKKTRLLRQLNREEAPDVDEIIRRWQADKSDFQAIDFESYPFHNEGDNSEKELDILIDYLKERNWLDKID